MSQPMNTLIPSIDKRLSAWADIQERMAHAPEARLRPTLTLSRQFGCEAFPLAQHLEERLTRATGEPWTIYDKVLIDKVAESEGINPRLLKNLGDRSRALEALGLMPKGHQTHDEAFEKVAKCLVRIAQAGNAVIVGRGGAVLCQGMRNAFHFRLEASVEFRVASIMRRLELPREAAERLVKENSRLRDRFFSECLGVDVNNLQYYDAVFNNERHRVEDIAAAILGYVGSAWPEKGYFGG